MPSEVPEGWQWTRVGGECNVLIGGTPARDQPSFWDRSKQGDNRWVSIADLRDKVISETKEYITDLGVQKSNVKRIAAGTVIMSFKLSIGRTAIAGCDLYTNEAIAAFTPKTERLDRDFAYYVLPSAAAGGDIDQAVKGKTLNKAKLLDLDVLLPPLPEQKKIAAVLSSVDEAIQATQLVIDQTRRVKEGLLQDLLTRGLPGHTRFKQTEIGEVPESWEVRPFGELVGTFIDYRGRTPKKLGMDWSPDGVPAVSANNVKPGRIDLADCNYGSEELYRRWMQNGACERGDVLMTMEAPLGNVATIPDDRRYILSQRVLLMRPLPDLVQKEYLAQLMQSRPFQRQLESRSTGTTAKGIQRARLIQVPVAIPPLAEQGRIRDIAISIDESVASSIASLERLRTTKSGLLQDLLTGKVRVST